MFGEDKIVGSSILKIDKNRIILPRYTKAEVGEAINMMYDLRLRKLLLLKQEDMQKRIDLFEEGLRKLSAIEQYDLKKCRQIRRIFFAKICVPEEIVKPGYRFHLPNSAISNLNLTDNLFAIGVENHLELYKDYDSYMKIFEEEEKVKNETRKI